MRVIGFIFLYWVSAVVYAQTDSYQKAKRLYTEATSLFESDTPTDATDKQALAKYAQAQTLLEAISARDTLYADCWIKTGALYDSQQTYSHAIQAYQKALAVWQRLKSGQQTTEGIFNTYTLLAQAFYKSEKYDSALYYGQQAENLVTKVSKAEQLQRFYNMMGALHYQNGNFQQSIFYTEKAFALTSQQAHTHASQLCSYQLNIASASSSLGYHTKALQAYQKALQYHYAQEIIYRKIGEVYTKTGKYDSAMYYLQKSAQPNNPENQVVVWNHMGDVYQKLQKYPEALAYYQKSIQQKNQSGNTHTVIQARSYLGIGEVAEARKAYTQALRSYQTALHLLQPSSSPKDISHTSEDFENVLSPLDFIVTLTHKAHAYQQNHAVPALQAALKNYQLVLRYAEQLRLSYDTDEAKLFFTQRIFPIYQDAVQVAVQLFQATHQPMYAEQAFFLSEKSKAAVLAESLQGLQITHTAHVSAQLLSQERDLKKTITKLTLADMQSTQSTHQTQLRDAQIRLSALLKKFDANEKYYQLKYNTTSLTLSQLRKRILRARTALIEYFWTDKQLFAFVLTAQKLHIHVLPADVAFYDSLKRYQNSLFNHQFSFEQSQWAHVLYRKVFAPLQKDLEGISHLIVVPDGQLCYLPLESLVQNAATESYLLEDYIFRYAYSATLLEFTTRHHTHSPVMGTLAMAPFAGKNGQTFRSTSLSPLPASKEEVEQIGGRIYLESQATKDVFMKMASHHGIIHLATHAKADNEKPINSYISFYPRQSNSLADYRLYTAELYNMHLDSVQLVVLSGCETGGGQWVRGEGVMSLARAFAYAGCPNIVMTLWRAEDQSTAQITTHMHQYLQKGYDKDEALTFAKRDYLREAPASRKNPYFWANFVLVGDGEPIYTSHRWRYWILGLACVLIVTGTYFFLRRKSRLSSFLP